MGMPLVTAEQIIRALRRGIGNKVEIFNEFPQDAEVVRNGVYVSDVQTVDRSSNQLGVTPGSNIYDATDSVEIIYVTYQGDVLRDTVIRALQTLVDDNDLLDGYHSRQYTVDEEWNNRAEYKTYTFSLLRMELQ
jgi:hypothetical protein